MNKKQIFKTLLVLGVAAILLGGSFALYLFNMPHRDVQATQADFETTSSELVAEYLDNPERADSKYLDEEGDSKILIVTGTVADVTEDLNDQKVVLLKAADDKAGASCTFTANTNAAAAALAVGQTVRIKGVIRSGAGYDADLDLYEDAVLEKCDIVKD